MTVGNAAAANPRTDAPVVDSPAAIRNVVMVGGSGSGKTTIVEGLLAATGVISRAGRVEEGTTVTDYDDAAKRTQRSVSLSIAPMVHGGVKINIIDAPGYADYLGDLRAALRGSDAALFVISAVDGVSGPIRMLWEECAEAGKPRAVLITKLDNARADYDGVVADCREAFGASVLPLALPLYETEETVRAIMRLLPGDVVDYASGKRVEREPQGDEVGKLERNRDALIEAIITESQDEILMDTYLEGGELDGKLLLADLAKAMSNATFFPIMPMAAAGGIGTTGLLQLIVDGFPSPADSPVPMASTPDGDVVELTCDPAGPLVAEVIKTTADPYVGRISLVRVFSGTLRPESSVHVLGRGTRAEGTERHEENERVGGLSSPLGGTQRSIDAAIAGDLCAVARLAVAETGDTLSDPATPLMIDPWSPPEPMLPVAISVRRSADEDKLSTGLARLAAEDPTLRLEQNPDTGQLVLWCMGEAHADVSCQQLEDKYGVAVDRIEYRVPLRETVKTKTTVKGRHVKQSGGHGQYAVADLIIEPLPAGSGFEFVDKVVGGAVPRQFIPSVEKGIRNQMAKGIAAGYPVVDLRATLFDGKAHSVDSSDAAFQMAGALALREAAKTGGVSMLEPVVEMAISVDDEFVGNVMSDLASRRGRVTGTEAGHGGRTVIRAEVPEIEVVTYASDLRSMARGTGMFTRTYIGHEAMPEHQAKQLLDKVE